MSPTLILLHQTGKRQSIGPGKLDNPATAIMQEGMTQDVSGCFLIFF
jgi:hypothetical protein